MRELIFDITELMASANGRLKYYGIARVVFEIGAELHKLDIGVRFAVYSASHKEFFEFTPNLDESSDYGVNFNLPNSLRQTRIRRMFYTRNKFRDLLAPLATRIIDRKNRRIWRESNAPSAPMDISNSIIVMAGRPKLMVDAIKTVKERGDDVLFVPLLHDVFSLHLSDKRRAEINATGFKGDNNYVIEAASLVLTNSHFTEADILGFVEAGALNKPAKITTVQLAHECRAGQSEPELELPEGEYLLTVGATIGRKNLQAVINALLHLKQTDRNVPKLVIAGAPRKRTRKFLARPEYAPIRELMIEAANPNQTDLVRLYQNALGLVIGSKIEGWGLPATEALWLGVPAICARAPIFKEVCGDLGLYFDPDDQTELAEIINNLSQVEGFRENLVARIREAKENGQFRKWSDVADDLVSAVETVRK